MCFFGANIQREGLHYESVRSIVGSVESWLGKRGGEPLTRRRSGKIIEDIGRTRANITGIG